MGVQCIKISELMSSSSEDSLFESFILVCGHVVVNENNNVNNHQTITGPLFSF